MFHLHSYSTVHFLINLCCIISSETFPLSCLLSHAFSLLKIGSFSCINDVALKFIQIAKVGLPHLFDYFSLFRFSADGKLPKGTPALNY